jgi:hypothetical protein
MLPFPKSTAVVTNPTRGAKPLRHRVAVRDRRCKTFCLSAVLYGECREPCHGGAIHQCVSKSEKERALKIKQAYLVLSSIIVAVIALLYGLSPQWFARSFLGVRDLDVNLAHILRAVMGLYIGFGLFWLFSALSNRHSSTAVLTTFIFAAGLVSGRIVSLVADGLPSPLLVGYTVAELAILPVAYWIYRLPEER